MSDVSWTVNTSPDGDQTVAYIEGPHPTLTRGQNARVNLGFAPGSTAYATLREYLDFTHAVVTPIGLDGTAYYRELHSDTEELLMSFEPTGTDHPTDVTGWWGVLTGGQDRSSLVGDPRLQFQVFVLAEFSEHADRGAAKTAHRR